MTLPVEGLEQQTTGAVEHGTGVVELVAELVAFYLCPGRTLDRGDQRRHQRCAGVVEGGDSRRRWCRWCRDRLDPIQGATAQLVTLYVATLRPALESPQRHAQRIRSSGTGQV